MSAARSSRIDAPDGPVVAAIRPEHVEIGESGALAVRVVGATYLGTSVRLKLETEALKLEAHVDPGGGTPGGRACTGRPPARAPLGDAG